jgi:hypothetical protein
MWSSCQNSNNSNSNSNSNSNGNSNSNSNCEQDGYRLRKGLDIYQMPNENEINFHSEEDIVAIGDLHGNAAKFFHLLIREGILKTSKEDYDTFVDIYKYSDSLYLEKHENHLFFLGILNRIEKTLACPKLCILGDDLCDRGKDDRLTLFKYKTLDQLGVEFDVIVSNHGMEFLKQYAYGFNGDDLKIHFQGRNHRFGNSLHALISAIDTKIVSEDEINNLIENNYLPHLKLLSYTIKSKDEIIIYSHAPINKAKIIVLSSILGVIPKFNTIKDMRATIDCINKAFSLIASNKISLKEFCDKWYCDLQSDFARFFWDSADKIEEENKNINNLLLNYRVINLHGHIGKEPSPTNYLYWEYINLDNGLGSKNISVYKGGLSQVDEGKIYEDIGSYPVYVAKENYAYNMECAAFDAFDVFDEDLEIVDIYNLLKERLNQTSGQAFLSLDQGILEKIKNILADLDISSANKIGAVFLVINEELENEKHQYEAQKENVSSGGFSLPSLSMPSFSLPSLSMSSFSMSSFAMFPCKLFSYMAGQGKTSELGFVEAINADDAGISKKEIIRGRILKDILFGIYQRYQDYLLPEQVTRILNLIPCDTMSEYRMSI